MGGMRIEEDQGGVISSRMISGGAFWDIGIWDMGGKMEDVGGPVLDMDGKIRGPQICLSGTMILQS